jgi:gamma-glutamyltranspeptidase
MRSAAQVPTEQLLSKEYAAERAALINRSRATVDCKKGTQHSQAACARLGLPAL